MQLGPNHWSYKKSILNKDKMRETDLQTCRFDIIRWTNRRKTCRYLDRTVLIRNNMSDWMESSINAHKEVRKCKFRLQRKIISSIIRLSDKLQANRYDALFC